MKQFTIILSILLFCSIIGCRKEKLPVDIPLLHPCRITVQMKGSPLEGATVSLLPEQGKWGAAGITNAQGIAELRTRNYHGVAEGHYKVTVSKIQGGTSPGTDEGTAIPPISLVNETFSNPEKTPLKCEIRQGKNSFDFTVDP
ncbi:MAG: carboxypeptidase-like regulatory domain-containing protein [Planctomycetaceae bacterium]|jgi:hypothetical protein|nr:carboxypeptidase-like regulatory domain-containing protein [Planctomycetaceae bacterium]